MVYQTTSKDTSGILSENPFIFDRPSKCAVKKIGVMFNKISIILISQE